MVDSAVVKDVKNYLSKLCDAGLPISFGVVFGSYANNTANEYSDIDLIVVSSEFDKTVSREDIKKLWRIAARTDSRIEPIPCGKDQWENDTSNIIIEIARTQGQNIAVA
ncbi:MAG: nucleotidyltransferase domain-containing protein [Anaerohalosphaeraceae bacterium]|nr:nucleotidyltransferase domain-containing protein [Anaerohalosphaeraceae bacterium]